MWAVCYKERAEHEKGRRASGKARLSVSHLIHVLRSVLVMLSSIKGKEDVFPPNKENLQAICERSTSRRGVANSPYIVGNKKVFKSLLVYYQPYMSLSKESHILPSTLFPPLQGPKQSMCQYFCRQ